MAGAFYRRVAYYQAKVEQEFKWIQESSGDGGLKITQGEPARLAIHPR